MSCDNALAEALIRSIEVFYGDDMSSLFEEFKESNPGVNVSFSMFNKLKPWYIRPNMIRDTCCRYHVEFQLYYDTFVDFCKKHWDGEPAPHTVRDFISMILCNRNPKMCFPLKGV